ncbi:MAG TPA: FHA domain-containing protein [Solirubrobacteraceae bacterium]|nr:FHA domain-containing protein [Solirubrobacteraceae bacterium]
MDSVTSGTFVGAGSFRCERCDYALTLEGSDLLSECPGCGNTSFVRASMFSTERIAPDRSGATLLRPAPDGHDEQLATARDLIEEPGEYLCYEESDELHTVALTREWTRIGRSLAADVRFDDPTVSRRHALIVRQPDGVRLLDDRSLNGVFVNGARVDGKALRDGDEIIVGRYRLSFVSVSEEEAESGSLAHGAPESVHSLH